MSEIAEHNRIMRQRQGATRIELGPVFECPLQRTHDQAVKTGRRLFLPRRDGIFGNFPRPERFRQFADVHGVPLPRLSADKRRRFPLEKRRVPCNVSFRSPVSRNGETDFIPQRMNRDILAPHFFRCDKHKFLSPL